MTSPARAPRPTPRQQAGDARSQRPDLRVVGPPVARPRVAGWAAVGAVFVFGALLASAIFHAQLVAGQVHLDKLDRSVREQQLLLQKDQLRLAEYQSPERIAREARRLHMVPATDQVWLSSNGDTTPATPDASNTSGSAGQLASDASTAGGTR